MKPPLRKVIIFLVQGTSPNSRKSTIFLKWQFFDRSLLRHIARAASRPFSRLCCVCVRVPRHHRILLRSVALSFVVVSEGVHFRSAALTALRSLGESWECSVNAGPSSPQPCVGIVWLSSPLRCCGPWSLRPYSEGILLDSASLPITAVGIATWQSCLSRAASKRTRCTRSS